MTRQEHLAWCKQRALEYANRGQLADAVASMISDMNKHEETKFGAGSILSMLGLQAAASNDSQAVKRYIEGFN